MLICHILHWGTLVTCPVTILTFQSVVDGDLCEQFNSLDYTKRKAIAEELDKTPAEVRYIFVIITVILNISYV